MEETMEVDEPTTIQRKKRKRRQLKQPPAPPQKDNRKRKKAPPVNESPGRRQSGPPSRGISGIDMGAMKKDEPKYCYCNDVSFGEVRPPIVV